MSNEKKISKNERIPLYYQLIDIIIEDIESGKFKENDKLPSERELCEKYNISRATVRKAIQQLEREEYVYKEHGKGTFVSPKIFEQKLLKLYSFTEEMKKIGKIPSSKVIDFNIINCNKEIANKMNIEVGKKVYKITRLRLANEKPMMLEDNYLVYKRFPGIKLEDIENEAMYDIMTNKFNVSFTEGEEIFQPVATRKHEAKLLQVSEGFPSMMLKRKTYEGDNIIEYTVGIARGDKFKYHVKLKV